MTRRRVLCGLLFASAVLACFAGWLWIADSHRVMRARFEQVKKGMTREEVIRTVGGPPGEPQPGTYLKANFKGLAYDDCWESHDGTLTVGWDDVVWGGYDATLVVRFDDVGTVKGRMIIDKTPPTLTERIRRWLGL
jgi:hypothetical protein